MATENLNLAPEDLLDSDLNDFMDAPAFQQIPPGCYSLVLGAMTIEEVGERNAVKINATILDTVELADAEDTAPEAGTALDAVFFIFDFAMAQGMFKELVAPLMEATGTSKFRDLLEAVNGLEVTAVTGVRADKKDKTKSYFEFKEFIVD